MTKEIYLLTGGEATRLKPLSEGIPKALLTIQGEKIIDLIIAKFLKIGDFHFNLICSIKHKQYWEEYAQKSNIDVNIIFETEKLDTAGYIIKHLNDFPESFYCMNGDLLLDVNLEDFISQSTSFSNSMIASIEVEDPSRFGVLQVDENLNILQFIEKPIDNTYGNKISLGLYHLRKSNLKDIAFNLEIPCSFERKVFPELSENKLLSTFTVSGHMLDVGTLESYIKAHITTEKENWISESSEVDPSAVIENTVILDDAIIEKNTEIKNSIIGPKTRIKEGSVIEEEIVRDLTQ